MKLINNLRLDIMFGTGDVQRSLRRMDERNPSLSTGYFLGNPDKVGTNFERNQPIYRTRSSNFADLHRDLIEKFYLDVNAPTWA